jgi:Flp pilus assembly pilin Flp
MTTNLLRRFLSEEDGQDLIEYALLSSFIGFSAWASVSLLRTALGNTYSTWDSNYQNDVLVEIPDPE